MTNEELIAKIREEIEQRIHDISHPLKDGYEIQSIGKIEGLSELLDFLSTLEEQAKEVRNPIFDECVANVDQKVRKEVRENIDFEQALYDHFGQVKDFTLGMRIGKYFYELGCRRTAEKYDEIEYNRQREEEKPMDLDEELNDEIKKYIEEYGYEKGADKLLIAIVARHFAEWQKEQNDKDLSEKIAAAYQLGLADKEKQMLKEARNHFVLRVLSDNTTKKMIELYNDEVDCKFGDVVRIIVLKKKDDK